MHTRSALACLAALAATSAGLTGSATASAPPTAPAALPQLKVLSHNVMLLPAGAGAVNDTRAGLLANASYLRGYDVVVLQELFDNTPSNTVLSGLASAYPNQTPVLGRSRSGWDQTLGAYSAWTPEDGGVAVLSKWPILKKVQYVYKDACGIEWYSNKGFVYVVLNVNGTKVHVVGTHAAAEDTSTCDPGEPARMRASQFAELDAFLDAQKIPAGEQVVVTGDLNVIKGSAEYTSMMRALDTVAPTAYAGAPYSWDPTSNGLAHYYYPDYAAEHLDYVLFRRGNARPATWTNTVLTPTSPPWQYDGRTFDDYSDHYPVAGS